MSGRERDDEARYDGVARFLHWLVVLLVIAQFMAGWAMPDVRKDSLPVGLIAIHLGVGTTLLAAMVARLIWRLTHRPPPENFLPGLNVLSRLSHFALYALLVAVPLLGWANASSRGWRVRLAGVTNLPALTGNGSSFGHALGNVHGLLAWALLAVIILHVAAALFHQFVLKDRILRRMAPWPSPPRPLGSTSRGASGP